MPMVWMLAQGAINTPSAGSRGAPSSSPRARATKSPAIRTRSAPAAVAQCCKLAITAPSSSSDGHVDRARHDHGRLNLRAASQVTPLDHGRYHSVDGTYLDVELGHAVMQHLVAHACGNDAEKDR